MKLIYMICLSGISVVTVAQHTWSLKKQRGTISVYEAPGKSGFKTVKVEATLEGTTRKLLELLKDVSRNHEWVYATKTSYLLQKASDSNLLYYAETALPWPIKNRDQPIRMIIHPVDPNNILMVTTTGEPKAIAVKEGLVRISEFSGTWRVRPVDDSHIFIDYILEVNPNGSIPAWVANMFVSKGPLETFTKLAAILKR